MRKVTEIVEDEWKFGARIYIDETKLTITATTMFKDAKKKELQFIQLIALCDDIDNTINESDVY